MSYGVSYCVMVSLDLGTLLVASQHALLIQKCFKQSPGQNPIYAWHKLPV